MRNLILLVVLVTGLVAGYFIGSYRGRAALEALEKAVETGKSLERERMATIEALKKNLADIDEQRKRDIEQSRKEFEARNSEWEKTKASLDATIKQQTAKLAEDSRNIDELASKLGGASGAEKQQLEQKIAQLRKQLAENKKEVEGNRCLATQVPRSVIAVLAR